MEGKNKESDGEIVFLISELNGHFMLFVSWSIF